MDSATRERVLENLFPNARQAVEPWESFPWHPSGGECDTWRRHSSQALAIDVFGTLKMAQPEERDAVIGALARELGVPPEGPWCIELEWQDTADRLCERQPTQVDAVACGAEAVIFFECKFTEADAGGCFQVRRLERGEHAGQRQCNGRYRLQTNPVSGVESRCALAGKGIHYWDRVPRVFTYRGDRDIDPCPFAGPWFQWMRNLVLCEWVASDRRSRPAFALVYADGVGLPFADKIRRKGMASLAAALRPEAISFGAMSYQYLLSIAGQAVSEAGLDTLKWHGLRDWVDRKVEHAVALRGTKKTAR
jgi:hypothetical protein